MPPAAEAPDAAALWQTFHEELEAFVRRRVASSHDADDVLQDLYLRLAQSEGRLRDAERAEAWVYRIARNALADYYRRRPNHAPLPDLPDAAGGEVHEEVLSWIRPAVQALPAKYRDAVWMADIERRPQQEVADHLGLSLSGAKSRIQRGRALLADNIQQCCEVVFDGEGRAVEYRKRPSRC